MEGMEPYEIMLGYVPDKNSSRPYKFWLVSRRSGIGCAVEQGYAETLDEAYERGKEALTNRITADKESGCY